MRSWKSSPKVRHVVSGRDETKALFMPTLNHFEFTGAILQIVAKPLGRRSKQAVEGEATGDPRRSRGRDTLLTNQSVSQVGRDQCLAFPPEIALETKIVCKGWLSAFVQTRTQGSKLLAAR